MTDEEFVNKVNSLRDQGLKDQDIAKIFGCSFETYYERILRYYRSILDE